MVFRRGGLASGLCFDVAHQISGLFAGSSMEQLCKSTLAGHSTLWTSRLDREPVSRLALREPVLTSEKQTVREAIVQMRQKSLGCAIVVDEDQKPVGMFTESMLVQLLLENPKIVDEPIVTHMAGQWPWVKLSDPIVDVLEALQTKNVRFVCVVDEDGRVAGLTGQKSLMEYVAEHFPEEVMVQRVGSDPYPHSREGA